MINPRISAGQFFRGDPALKAWWDFEYQALSDFAKAASYPLINSGAIYAPAAKDGRNPQSRAGFYFDGASHYLYNNSALITQNGEYSFICWFSLPAFGVRTNQWAMNQTSTIGTNYAAGLALGDGGDNSGSNPNWAMIQPGLVSGQRTAYVDMHADSFFRAKLKKLYCLIGTYSDASSRTRLFIDGIFANENGVNDMVGGMRTIGNEFLIGCDTSGKSANDRSMYGTIYHAAVVSRELQPQEISQYVRWAKTQILMPYPYLKAPSGAQNYTSTLTETVTNTDTVLKQASRTLSETFTSTDTILKMAGKVLAETATYTDSLIRTIQRVFTETITNTDSVIRTLVRELAETAVYTDTFTALKVLYKELTDTFTSTDTFIRSIAHTMAETVSYTDSLIRTLVRELATEVVSYTDSVIKLAGRVLSETVSNTDSMIRTISRTLTDTATYTATFASLREFGAILTETVTHTATLTKLISRTLSETVTHTARFAAYLNGMTAGIWRKVARVAKTWRKIGKP